MKPNYTDMGLGCTMGKQLRKEVERQLIEDAKYYGLIQKEYRFDWSNSCVEGRCTDYLDGSLDRFSGIYIYDENDRLTFDGWMDFVHEEDFFAVYWLYLDRYQDGHEISVKNDKSMPWYIYRQIPESFRKEYKKSMIVV